MQTLTTWASPSANTCVISQLNLQLYSCSSSIKWGEKRRSLGFCPNSYRGLLFLSSCFRGFKSRVVVIDEKRESKGKFFCWPRPKKGAAFAVALALDEKQSFCNNVADEELDNCYDDDDDNNHEENDVKRSAKDDVENGSIERADVRALAYSLHSAKTADDVEKVLKGKEKLPLQVFSTIIKGYGKEKRIDSAMALFKWLKRKSKESEKPIELNLYIYNNTLGALKYAENFDVVEEIISDMAMEGMNPNVVTYNTLMGIYIEQGRQVEAIKLLEEMKAKCISPSPASYSTVIYAYHRMEDGFGALSFFAEIKDKYRKGEIGKDSDDNKDWDHEFVKLEDFITRVGYRVMESWLLRSENLSSNVFRFLKEMDKVGLHISLDEYERLIKACKREEHYHVARELYIRIRTTYSEISLFVCNHVIWLFGKAMRWRAALEIYEDLLDKGPKPDKVSHDLIVSHFNILLSAARRKGLWKWGVSLLNRMEEKGLEPGIKQWNLVLVTCSKALKPEAAIEIFKRMVERGEMTTTLSYGALLSVLEKGDLYEEAVRVWEHVFKVGIKPNLHLYTIMASVYAGQGKFDMVDSLIREMVYIGVLPMVLPFNAIISSYRRKNMVSVAYEWFQRMKVLNVNPNAVTYEMLIEGLGKDGKPMIAYELYLKAKNEGIDLSSKAYDAVVRSSEMYGATIDVSSLGPRPSERKKKKVQVEVR